MLRATALFTLRPDTIVNLGPAMEPPEASLIELSPIALITRGLRGLAGRTERDIVASLFGDRTLAVHPDAPIEDIELLRFEMQVVEALHESPRTFADWSWAGPSASPLRHAVHPPSDALPRRLPPACR